MEPQTVYVKNHSVSWKLSVCGARLVRKELRGCAGPGMQSDGHSAVTRGSWSGRMHDKNYIHVSG